MRPLHEFLLGAGFLHAAISAEGMAEYLNRPEFRKMGPAAKLKLVMDLEAGRYARIHLYRMNDWSEQIKKETHGNPEQRLDEEIKAFKERNKTGPKVRYMREESPFAREPKPGEFKRQVLVLEPKRGWLKKLLRPLGF